MCYELMYNCMVQKYTMISHYLQYFCGCSVFSHGRCCALFAEIYVYRAVLPNFVAVVSLTISVVCVAHQELKERVL